jgi:hypothetical protein
MRSILIAALACVPAAAADTNRACALVTAEELEGALGAKVSGLKPSGMVGEAGMPKDIQICSGSSRTATIMLRIAKGGGGGGSGNAAAKGIEIAKKMGAQVDVKTFGPITCSTMTPPKNLEQYGFNTTCSVVKGGQVAAIEVTAKTKNDVVPIDKLRPLAEKMASRF